MIIDRIETDNINELWEISTTGVAFTDNGTRYHIDKTLLLKLLKEIEKNEQREKELEV